MHMQQMVNNKIRCLNMNMQLLPPPDLETNQQQQQRQKRVKKTYDLEIISSTW